MTTTIEESPPVASAGRRARRSRIRRTVRHLNLRGVVFAIGLILLIEVATATVLTSHYLPRPSEIGRALWLEIQRGDILSGITTTMGAYARGLGLAIIVGVVAGALLGASDILWELFRGVIEFLRPLPSVALIPFSILLLGVGSTTTVAMTFYASLWPILYNTYYGVHRVNQVSIDAARTFGLRRWQIFLRVQLPAAATNIATGVRVSAAIALIVVITVEIITRNGGLGYYIVRMQVAIRVEDMYAGIIVVGILGFALAMLVEALEQRVIFWNVDRRSDRSR